MITLQCDCGQDIGLLSSADVAEALGIKHNSVRTYITRGVIPKADFYIQQVPVWLATNPDLQAIIAKRQSSC